MGIFIFLIDKRIHVFLIMYSSYTRNQNIKRKCFVAYSGFCSSNWNSYCKIFNNLPSRQILANPRMATTTWVKYGYLIFELFSLYVKSTREEWASPVSRVHAINSSEFLSFLNVENSLSNLMARMLSLLTLCTQSFHWRNASTNADTKQSRAVNISFPCVFNRIALAKQLRDLSCSTKSSQELRLVRWP